MSSYKFENNTFIIEDYDKSKTFSSFLPGVAGELGVPLWAFYSNRGQGITSFGIQNKNNPIMEFFPANTAYQYVNTYGFRSFVKVNGVYYEPFNTINNEPKIKRNMYIKFNEFSIEEINEVLGIKYTVDYFVLANEPFAGLVRNVTVENITDKDIEIQLLDGIANILPYGVSSSVYKEMSNLMRSWMDVFNLENNIPFFRFRASSEDKAEIDEVVTGNFYLSYNGDGEIIRPIIDASVIFDYDTSLSVPISFVNNTINRSDEVKENKVPCAFSEANTVIKAYENITIKTIIGQIENVQLLNDRAKDLVKSNYVSNKREIGNDIIGDMLNDVHTETNNEIFDSYIKQCYLDNWLRGGYPKQFGNKNYYLYSRKHGDPERDYNFFDIRPEYYSQGNGNFRDVNQNRRSDVLIKPKTENQSIKLFYSLIQLDGYNPLEVRGYTYSLDKKAFGEILEKYINNVSEKDISLCNEFSPGVISKMLTYNKVDIDKHEQIICELLENATENIQAKFGEGYWSDHFTYNQDLIENYLLVYPDKKNELLFEDCTYKVFESHEIVLPRKRKYKVVEGKVRQFGSVVKDDERIQKLGLDTEKSNWLKCNNDEYTTNLINKMILLAITKFLNLDPYGIGIEMEANKPGWNDAMNGLPGVIGSGVSETIELSRIVEFVNNVIDSNADRTISILDEILDVIKKVEYELINTENQHDYWSNTNDIKETYRENIRLGVSDNESQIQLSSLSNVFALMKDKLYSAMQKAFELDDIIPTFLYYDAVNYEVLENDEVVVKEFKLNILPRFLEAPARYIKTAKNKSKSINMYEKIKQTGIYDEKLKMYKTSESIEHMGNEIGRIRAFTPGWQERESVFLHMTYKYLLGLLKAGMYEQYFEEIQNNYVCFSKPEVYGRNPIENSSFIATSVNPDKRLHGQGFVARLSGSTAEMLSMWTYMMVGHKWFGYDNDTLTFELTPVLPKSWFRDNKISFMLFSKIKVTYINETEYDTFDSNVCVSKYVIDGVEYLENELHGAIAEDIRNCNVNCIVAYITKK